MTACLELLGENDQELVQEALQPGWIDPMLTMLTEDHFFDLDIRAIYDHRYEKGLPFLQ